jgi:NADH-quinone oxidoreductase subunit E
VVRRRAARLEHAECPAACDYAPVVTVNYEFFDQRPPESAISLVGQLWGGERPMPSRGRALCTFKQIERQIGGFLDERREVAEASGSGVTAEIGVKVAEQRGESALSYSTSAPTLDPAVPAEAN